MSGAEQWLTFPLLDSYLKLLQLKHTGIGEGKKKVVQRNQTELRNRLRNKQNLALTRWYFKSAGKRLIIQPGVVAPLISHLEKGIRLDAHQTPYLKNKLQKGQILQPRKVKL